MFTETQNLKLYFYHPITAFVNIVCVSGVNNTYDKILRTLLFVRTQTPKNILKNINSTQCFNTFRRK